MISENDSYIVRPCEIDDISEAMDFFGREWTKRHLFAASKEYVNYFFYNSVRKNYNIIISTDKKNEKIIGLLSYVPNTRFDSSIAPEDKFIWLCNWLAAKDSYKGMGLSLYGGLVSYEQTKNLGTVGCNDEAIRLYKAMRFKTGSLKHYFLINDELRDFAVLSGYIKNPDRLSGLLNDDSYELLRLDKSFDTLSISNGLVESSKKSFPRKTLVYLLNKYMKSPYRNYFLYTVKKRGHIRTVIALRGFRHQGSSVLRIVDFIGGEENLTGLYYQFQELCRSFGAEYIDFYCMGISDNVLKQSGFELSGDYPGLIVPDYFEPFYNGNIDIRYAYHLNGNSDYRVFRGDCDRDFPRFAQEDLCGKD